MHAAVWPSALQGQGQRVGFGKLRGTMPRVAALQCKVCESSPPPVAPPVQDSTLARSSRTVVCATLRLCAGQWRCSNATHLLRHPPVSTCLLRPPPPRACGGGGGGDSTIALPSVSPRLLYDDGKMWRARGGGCVVGAPAAGWRAPAPAGDAAHLYVSQRGGLPTLHNTPSQTPPTADSVWPPASQLRLMLWSAFALVS